MVGAIFMVYGFIALLAAVNAARPMNNPTTRFPAVWLWAMLVGEYAGPLLVIRLSLSAALIWLGALTNTAGRIGFVFMAIGQATLLLVWLLSRSEARRLTASLPANSRVAAQSWGERLTRRPMVLPPGTELVCGVDSGEGTSVDVYRPLTDSANAPALVYVHGGSWTSGNPHQQSRTLFHHFAANGWHVFAVRYPLEPVPTFPANVNAVMSTVRWVSARPEVDAERVVLCGGSAGGHLATLAALKLSMGSSSDGPAACVPLYGIFDFANRNNTRPHWEIIPRAVLGVRLDDNPALYRAASPLDQVHTNAPPMMVIHGTFDSLVPPQESDQFVQALLATSNNQTEYLRVRGGQHAFDAISSPRTRAVVAAIYDWVSSTAPTTTTPMRPVSTEEDLTGSGAPTPDQPSDE